MSEEENIGHPNLEIVYKESCEAARNQQSSIDLLYNKLNWVLVSDAVLLAAMFGSGAARAVPEL